MSITRALMGLSIGFVIALPVQSSAQALNKQQQLFLDTLQAAEAGRKNDVYKGLEQLHNYPLTPYIVFAELRGRIAHASQDEVDHFLTTHADSPLAGRMLFAYTTQLGLKKDWGRFQTYYNRLQRPNAQQQCFAGLASLALGDREGAYQQAAQLWQVGASQHDACDPLFERWIASGGLQSNHALERMLLSLESGNTRLARYAERFIKDDTTKQHAATVWRVYNNPEQLRQNPGILSKQTPQHRRLAMMAVNRLAGSDLELALNTWIGLVRHLDIPAPEQEPLATRLGVRYAKRFLPGTEELLARLDPDFNFGELTEWRIRLALVDQAWPQVASMIEKLPDELRQNPRWQYWTHVSHKRLGIPYTQDALEQLVSDRSFYSFIAAEHNNLPFELKNTPAPFDAAALNEIAQLPAFRRMHELYQINQINNARSEWNHATTYLTQDQQHAAAHLVKSWGWYFQGIRGAIGSDRWDDLELRFPTPYTDLFHHASGKYSIERAWAMAVTRQESAFLEDARSGAGAMGLMQLMPATAREVAQRNRIDLPDLSRLSQPAVNIELGSAYLSQMQQRFNGNRVYATAAYNAGPGRVQQWLNARGHLPLDIWIETIPFDETRLYVQNVLSYGVIYDHLTGQRPSMMSQSERQLLALNDSR
ncbi:transglycosylase SLT domain-containing protein [Nitrincola alkalilacustris]|uniref:transglycosylase SLT domain-containing protein n=1 Tax=Nitrincola alkalilacustris TaxID=1571224 RepID=UPI00124D511C|nr:transglycosylase SLT domain-containing protein [Nitrincola alkalilacustris]